MRKNGATGASGVDVQKIELVQTPFVQLGNLQTPVPWKLNQMNVRQQQVIF